MSGLEVVGAIASIGAILNGTRKSFNFIRSIPGIKDEWESLNNEASDPDLHYESLYITKRLALYSTKTRSTPDLNIKSNKKELVQIDGLEILIEVVNSQFSLEDITQPQTEPIRRSFKQLTQILNDLNTTSTRVTQSKTSSKSGIGTFKPNKPKWLWLKEDIGKIYNRLRDAKNDLNLAIRLADRQNHVAMTQAFQAMISEFGTMKVQFSMSSSLHQQLQQFLDASYERSYHDQSARIEDVTNATSPEPDTLAHPAAAEGGAITYTARQEVTSAQSPFACPRPCFCRCHHEGMFSWSRCDYNKCQRNNSSQKATWSLHLARWLCGYGVYFSVSASLRPKVVFSSGDKKLAITSSKYADEAMVQRFFYGIHPLDEYERGGTVLDRTLYYSNFVVLGVLVTYWDAYFRQHGISRADFFKVQEMLLKRSCSERNALAAKKFLSYSELDGNCASTTLHQAIRDGDCTRMLEALAKEPFTATAYDLRGNSTMILAAESRARPLEMMIALKGAGVDIHQRDRNERTPLMCASWAGNTAGVKWLLEQDSSGHKLRDSRGLTALHSAMGSRSSCASQIIKLLLEAGADPNARDNRGNTPLSALGACRAEYAACKVKIDLLLAAGANLNSRNEMRETPISRAIRRDNVGAIRALFTAGAPIDDLGLRFGGNLCHRLATYSREKTLWRLFENETFVGAGVDPFVRDKAKDSPWDLFICALQHPPQAITRLKVVSKHSCRGFEAVYTQIRDSYLQGDIDILQQVADLIRDKDAPGAASKLLALAEQREPMNIWAAGEVVMQPLRSIHLHIREGDSSCALEAVLEQIGILREKMDRSPWEEDSRWWRQKLQAEGASEEDWRRQAAFARRMREEGLRRWHRYKMAPANGSVDGELWEDASASSK